MTKPSDEWDKKENDKDEFMSLAKEAIKMFTKKADEPQTRYFNVCLTVTSEEMEKIGQILKENPFHKGNASPISFH